MTLEKGGRGVKRQTHEKRLQENAMCALLKSGLASAEVSLHCECFDPEWAIAATAEAAVRE